MGLCLYMHSYLPHQFYMLNLLQRREKRNAFKLAFVKTFQFALCKIRKFVSKQFVPFYLIKLGQWQLLSGFVSKLNRFTFSNRKCLLCEHTSSIWGLFYNFQSFQCLEASKHEQWQSPLVQLNQVFTSSHQNRQTTFVGEWGEECKYHVDGDD